MTQPVRVTDTPYQGVLTDSKYTAPGSLLTFVEGSNWTVQYYSQVLGSDNAIGPQQLDRAAPYQQYWLIKNFEMKVTQPLTAAQDDQTKTMTANGGATTYPYFVPNKGDMFTADMGDGRVGRFAVTDTDKKTYLKESVYTIEYTLLGYLDDAAIADFAKKTVRTTYFVKDFITFGQNPMVTSEAYNDNQTFAQEYENLIGQYMRDFFSRDYQTLLIPGQENRTSYDPFLPKAFLSVVSTTDNPNVSRIRQPGVAGDEAMQCATFWDALLEMNPSTLYGAMQKAMLFPTLYFKSLPRYSGIYYSGIQQVLYPLDARTDVDSQYDDVGLMPGGGVQIVFAGRRYTDLNRLMGPTTIDNFDYQAPIPGVLPLIVPVTYDDYYVFSAGFYGMEDKTPVSQLELLTLQAIRGEAMDSQVLHNLARQALKWENLERYYYTPVILILLKIATRQN